MPNIYLEKDGQIVAEVGGYRAGKEERGGGYVVTAYHIYPTAYTVARAIDIAELKDFRLICETNTRRIRYQISGWGGRILSYRGERSDRQQTGIPLRENGRCLGSTF